MFEKQSNHCNYKLIYTVKMILNVILKPRRVYRGLIILFSAILLYIIVFRDELSENWSTPTQEEPRGLEKIISLKIENHSKELIRHSRSPIPLEKLEFDTENEIVRLKMKYILLWTPTVTPFNVIRKRGRVPFLSNNCKYTNCFLTHNRNYLADKTRFDAVVFSIAALKDLKKLPKERSLRQKFVAASTEPPQKHPVVNPIFDGYFNWTWTYRLNSDVLWRSLRIFEYYKGEVGPRTEVNWQENYGTRIAELEELLAVKKRAVVWMKTNCKQKTEQAEYVKDLHKELFHFGINLAICSNCSGYETCGNIEEMSRIVRYQYYFFLAFEEYFDEDYVTDIILRALQNFVVPIVMGGADYSRFLPPRSYLDATQLGPREMAEEINKNMENFYLYQEYFRWIWHYFYESTGLESEVCNICTALNDEELVNSPSVYNEFRKMWNGETSQQIADFLFDLFENDTDLKTMLKNSNYSEIRKAFKKKYLPNPEDSVYVFDMDRMNIPTTTEGVVIPDELTSETTFEL